MQPKAHYKGRLCQDQSAAAATALISGREHLQPHNCKEKQATLRAFNNPSIRQQQLAHFEWNWEPCGPWQAAGGNMTGQDLNPCATTQLHSRRSSFRGLLHVLVSWLWFHIFALSLVTVAYGWQKVQGNDPWHRSHLRIQLLL